MTGIPLRSIVVIDVGASNAKAVHFGPDLVEIASRTTSVTLSDGPPYLAIEPGPVLDFARAAITAFDARLPVDVIVPCTHGSSLVLLDDAGAQALPVMSYLSPVPEEIATAYADITPPFAEVLAPVNPGALTLARQLLWQETRFPEAFARVATILPYAQYLGLRLGGGTRPVTEVSALGAQTHLWAPRKGRYSALAHRRGWSRLFAPLCPAWQPLGQFRGPPLRGLGTVLAGVHDSNANFHRYRGLGPLVLLSTGTWIIAFDNSAPLDALDGGRDQVSNTGVDGTPIACARFMGGEEFRLLAGPETDRTGTLGDVGGLVAQASMALPSFTQSGGPMPATGGRGRISGPPPDGTGARASLAALYTAAMTAVTLDGLGTTPRVVVDGPFSRNPLYLSLLAALLPDRDICRSDFANGTASGAALLAFGAEPPDHVPAPVLTPVEPARIPGLAAYHNDWLARAQA